MAADTSSSQPARLSAKYTSPTNEHFTLQSDPLPPLSPSFSSQDPVAQKKAYLAALRVSTTKMQEEINTLLTARMAEDNERNGVAGADGAAASGGGKSKCKKTGNKNGGAAAVAVNEDAEEENYGEEVVDEDD